MSKFVLAIAVALIGCATFHAPERRLENAQVIASKGGLALTHVPGTIPLHAYTRIGEPSSPVVHVYIEGDGFAYVTRNIPSNDPTPAKPTALELAAVDSAPNVVYLARPCQFLSRRYEACDRRHWTTDRYGQSVVDIFHEALDTLARKHQFSQFHLIGFSGGATISAVLAAQRDDVASLRTVAGNLDVWRFVEIHRISPMPTALNPALFGEQLRRIPQVHFVGEQDYIVPIEVAKAYCSRLGQYQPDFTCPLRIVDGMNHYSDWHPRWPELLEEPLSVGSTLSRWGK